MTPKRRESLFHQHHNLRDNLIGRMLGKLTNITHSYWSHTVWHTKTTPYSASKLFQSNPMNPEGSECVWVCVCVCPSGVKPGVFSIKAIHPLWQLSSFFTALLFFPPTWSIVYVCVFSSLFPKTTVCYTHTDFFQLPP